MAFQEVVQSAISQINTDKKAKFQKMQMCDVDDEDNTEYDVLMRLAKK